MDTISLARLKMIIRESNYDNTYKMAWAKAIVELCSQWNKNEDILKIELADIAKKYFKYYWNQTIFFDLNQSSNPTKKPIIIQYIKLFIEEYFTAINKRQPELFEKVEDRFARLNLQESYKDTIKKIVKILKIDVSWRFTVLPDKLNLIGYEYTKGTEQVFINKEFASAISLNQQDLYDLINYRWSLILENFNSSPRINKKVRIMDEREVKRNSLSKFKKYLDIQNPNHFCFICGKKMKDSEISIDHVIPWSYMYSDDLWNLVYVCKHCNSIKSNVIPNENEIKRLKERNHELANKLEENKIVDSNYEELKTAINNNYENKFWVGCKC